MFSHNLFKNLPQALRTEVFETLFAQGEIKIERIISKGNDSDWMTQAQDEWVALLQGEAILAFEDDMEVFLHAGDCLHIPAGQKHRVKWTTAAQKSIWLAIHFPPQKI